MSDNKYLKHNLIGIVKLFSLLTKSNVEDTGEGIGFI